MFVGGIKVPMATEQNHWAQVDLAVRVVIFAAMELLLALQFGLGAISGVAQWTLWVTTTVAMVTPSGAHVVLEDSSNPDPDLHWLDQQIIFVVTFYHLADTQLCARPARLVLHCPRIAPILHLGIGRLLLPCRHLEKKAWSQKRLSQRLRAHTHAHTHTHTHTHTCTHTLVVLVVVAVLRDVVVVFVVSVVVVHYNDAAPAAATAAATATAAAAATASATPAAAAATAVCVCCCCVFAVVVCLLLL